MTWWKRHPGELEREIEELQAAGRDPKLDNNAFQAGKAVIHISLDIFGKQYASKIVYPDLYPYFRPLIFTSDMDFNLRHYNPFSGEKCLLRRGSRHWLPGMTAASLISEMLPKWEQAATLSFKDERIESEDNQAEPKSVYIQTHPTHLLMVDSSWEIPQEIKHGRLKIAFPGDIKKLTPQKAITGWILEIQDNKKQSIEGLKVADIIRDWGKGFLQKTISCRWTSLDTEPQGGTAESLMAWLRSQKPIIFEEIHKEIISKKNGLYGLCFREEAPGRTYRDGWIFIAWHHTSKTRRKKKQVSFRYWLIKAEPAGEKDLFERIPELTSLRNKTIAMVGLGCVGAPSALALARAGIGELRLLDCDYVGPGTACRWPLGMSAAGYGKVEIIEQFVKTNYPFTKIGTDHYPPDRFVIGQPDSLIS